MSEKNKLEGKTVSEWLVLAIKVEFKSKGYALRELGRYEDATACFDKVFEMNSEDDVIWSNKGDALCKLSRYNKIKENHFETLKKDKIFRRYDKIA